jgi:poly(3-hydroxybutyrate) depolymerase
VQGGGHTWPGGEEVAFLGATTTDLSATARISAFFAAHAMP